MAPEQSRRVQSRQFTYVCDSRPPLTVEFDVFCRSAASESGQTKPIWLLTYLWSHASYPLKPSYQPALSRLCFPNPINIFYAHSFSPPPHILFFLPHIQKRSKPLYNRLSLASSTPSDTPLFFTRFPSSCLHVPSLLLATFYKRSNLSLEPLLADYF